MLPSDMKQVGIRPLAMTLHRAQAKFRKWRVIRQKDMAGGYCEFAQLRLRFGYCETGRLLFFSLIFPWPRGEAQETALRRRCRMESRQRLDKTSSRFVHHVVRENGRDDNVHVEQCLIRRRGHRQSPL